MAILLPSSALVLYIKYTNSIYPKQRVIEVVWTNDKALRTNPSIERFERRLTKTENKKYKQFGLLDGCKHDREELKLIRKETQKVILLQDTTIGIHIHLGPDTKLWTVVCLHDIINNIKDADYIQHGDDLWIFYKPQIDLPHL